MMNLSIIISILSLVGISNLFSQWIKKEFELLFYYSCLFSLLVLYISGLTGTLETSVILLRYAGLAGLLLFLSAKFRGEFKVTYGMIFLIISIGFLLWSINTANYEYYYGSDDYHHWGKSMRQLTNDNRLTKFSDPGDMKDNPPAAALFQYIFSYFTGYQINIGIFGQGILTLSILSILFLSFPKQFTKTNTITFIVTMGISASMVWFFRYGFHTLQTDLLLGSTLGISICIYHRYKNQDYITALALAAPSILSLVLIKHIGILFVTFALFIIAIDTLINNKKNIFKIALILVAIFGAALLIRYSWNDYLHNQGIQITKAPNFTLIDIAMAFIPAYSNTEQKVIIGSYINYLFFSDHSSTYWFFISLFLLYTNIKLNLEAQSKNQTAINIGFYICFTAYLFILLILYIFTFSFFEASRVLSATRYINTMILSIIIYLSYVNIEILNKIKLKTSLKKITAFAILILILPNASIIITDTYASYNNSHTQKEVHQVEQMSLITKNNTPADSKIYFIWSDSDNDKSHIFNYSIYPRHSNQDCISIKKNKSTLVNEEDPWSCLMNSDEFKNLMLKYDYIYIGFSSEEFESEFFNKYNTLDKSQGLFEIQKNNDNILFVKHN